jgi:hypothetical protein
MSVDQKLAAAAERRNLVSGEMKARIDAKHARAVITLERFKADKYKNLTVVSESCMFICILLIPRSLINESLISQ